MDGDQEVEQAGTGMKGSQWKVRVLRKATKLLPSRVVKRPVVYGLKVHRPKSGSSKIPFLTHLS